jgi:hypothetical protein
MGFQDPSIGNIAFTVGATDMEHWDSGNFYVTHSGNMTAKGATIQNATITKATLNDLTVNGIVCENSLQADSIVCNGNLIVNTPSVFNARKIVAPPISNN